MCNVGKYNFHAYFNSNVNHQQQKNNDFTSKVKVSLWIFFNVEKPGQCRNTKYNF